jgi:arylsulfatase A-like enzyme
VSTLSFASRLIAVSLLALSVSPLQAQSDRTNFIVVFIDDMGWSDLSCFGNTAVETENIDRLAKEGLRFTNFYVNAPICSPSRTAITTGQYPYRWRISSYLNNRQDNARRGVANWLEPSAPSLARILKGAGYSTGHFGKWHMGGQRDVSEAPLIEEYGFDDSLTNFEGLGPRLLPLCDAFDGKPPKKHALGSDTLGHGEITWMDRSVITQGFVERTIDFVKASQAAGKPFYVNVWPDDVHSPFFPPQAMRGSGSKRDLYHGVLNTMDEQLGKLFDFVREDEHLRENTLIVLCSDNGPEMGAGSALPLRGHKANLYEGGIRSPLIVWGPAFIEEHKRGSTNTENYFCAMDLVPSLLSIAELRLEGNQGFDGEDISATLLGLQNRSRVAPICWRRPPDRPGTKAENFPDLAIRDGNWKLLIEYDGSKPQLYDLEADPAEEHNLARQQPLLTLQLRGKLLAWNATMPPDRGPELESERDR